MSIALRSDELRIASRARATGRRDVAVGIPAYNEERNIGRLLQSVLDQSAADRIARIVVIASDCDDATAEIARSYAEIDPRIEVIEEPVRRGKVYAVNRLLGLIKEPIFVLSCADLCLNRATLEKLLEPFEDASVGCVAARPIPLNDKRSMVGFGVHMMWDMHHRVSSIVPKVGELMAFRNTIAAIDHVALADEVAIEQEIAERGLRIVYAPLATVSNQGPTTFAEFYGQRKHWIAANYDCSRVRRYHVSTLSFSNLVRAALAFVRDERPRLDWFGYFAAVEVLCRIDAWISYQVRGDRRRYQVWTPVATTKVLEGV
jgi:cellulose synthase/poly-beta-1,6-N-acetylglucosamine synthase-like glycosyltransferase